MIYALVYDEPQVLKAVGRFWRRVVGLRFLLAMVAMLGFFVYALVRGDRSWYVGATGTVLVFASAMITGVYFMQRRRAVTALHRLDDGRATMVISQEGLRFETAKSHSDLSWNVVTEVWRYPDMWLLVYGRAAFSTLPLEQFDAAGLAAIADGVTRAGGKLR